MGDEKKASFGRRWLTRLQDHPLIAVAAAVAGVGAWINSITDTAGNLYAKAEDLGWVSTEKIKCWNKTVRPADASTDGVRVVERSTTLDLSGWKTASADDLARKTPVELAVSRNRFVVERTDAAQGCFLHRMGSSSGIEPKVHCGERCRKVALAPKPGDPLREWNLIFDVQREPIGAEIPIEFSVEFWNSFQRPDQWWGGFRILHATEKATYTIIFPEDKLPNETSLQYRFVRLVSQKSEQMENPVTDVRLRSGLAERVTWSVPSPQPDRSYRIYWAW